MHFIKCEIHSNSFMVVVIILNYYATIHTWHHMNYMAIVDFTNNMYRCVCLHHVTSDVVKSKSNIAASPNPSPSPNSYSSGLTVIRLATYNKSQNLSAPYHLTTSREKCMLKWKVRNTFYKCLWSHSLQCRCCADGIIDENLLTRAKFTSCSALRCLCITQHFEIRVAKLH